MQLYFLIVGLSDFYNVYVYRTAHHSHTYPMIQSLGNIMLVASLAALADAWVDHLHVSPRSFDWILPRSFGAPFKFSIHASLPDRENEKNEIMESRVDASSSERRRKILFSLLSSVAGIHTPTYLSQDEALAEILPQSSISTTSLKEKTYIIIPPLDTRSYDTFTLSNGLRVLLCSDRQSNTAAAAINVHAGASSDPAEIPGLAHFNEHMLFLGTRSYPEEGSFESFLSSNGGSSNAFTEGEDTVYYFDMNAESDSKMAEGLDRFASFFTSPLFTESATGRELNAIESENSKNLQSDAFRFYQIEKSRASSKHPYSKFYTGNKATLLEGTQRQNLDLRTELIKFWSTFYNADQMSLAVIAPQSIESLKKMILDSFPNIRNNSDRPFIQPEDQWGGIIPPFTGQVGDSIIPSQGYMVQVVPVADARQVQIVWPVVYTSSQDRMNQYLIKPAVFVSHLLGHEGRNSLLSYLKRQGWANALGASIDADFSDFYTFGITVELTPQGLIQVEQVIEAIFSYISMMNVGNSIPRYIFEEVLRISELNWRFLTKVCKV